MKRQVSPPTPKSSSRSALGAEAWHSNNKSSDSKIGPRQKGDEAKEKDEKSLNQSKWSLFKRDFEA